MLVTSIDGGAVVSIPIGFSHQLRHAIIPDEHADAAVSIPIGFSHQLRQCKHSCKGTPESFQSLSGFLIS